MVALVRRGPRDEGLEPLPHTAVRELTLELGRARAQTRKARPGCRLTCHVEQARLAEPGRGFDEDDPAVSLLCLSQGIPELSEQVLALEKRADVSDFDARRFAPAFAVLRRNGTVGG